MSDISKQINVKGSRVYVFVIREGVVWRGYSSICHRNFYYVYSGVERSDFKDTPPFLIHVFNFGYHGDLEKLH